MQFTGNGRFTGNDCMDAGGGATQDAKAGKRNKGRGRV